PDRFDGRRWRKGPGAGGPRDSSQEGLDGVATPDHGIGRRDRVCQGREPSLLPTRLPASDFQGAVRTVPELRNGDSQEQREEGHDKRRKGNSIGETFSADGRRSQSWDQTGI